VIASDEPPAEMRDVPTPLDSRGRRGRSSLSAFQPDSDPFNLKRASDTSKGGFRRLDRAVLYHAPIASRFQFDNAARSTLVHALR
jgi:hypothetical protein